MLRLTPLLLALWWVLTDGSSDGWSFGVAAVALSLGALHVATSPERRDVHEVLRWTALPAFAWFFLGRSLLAGIDVARRTLSPTMPLSPAMVRFPTELPPGRACVLLVATLTLLPGTLGVDLDGNIVTLHVLDDRTDIERDIRVAERAIGPLFARPLDASVA